MGAPNAGGVGQNRRLSTNNRWYTQLDRRWFVYDTWDNGSRLGLVMVECTLSITRCLRLNLQLHTIDLVRTCRLSSFCTVAWQLARFQLTLRVARSLGDSWASCTFLVPDCPGKQAIKWVLLNIVFLLATSGVLGGIRGCTAYTNLRVFFDSVYSPQWS